MIILVDHLTRMNILVFGAGLNYRGEYGFWRHDGLIDVIDEGMFVYLFLIRE